MEEQSRAPKQAELPPPTRAPTNHGLVCLAAAGPVHHQELYYGVLVVCQVAVAEVGSGAAPGHKHVRRVHKVGKDAHALWAALGRVIDKDVDEGVRVELGLGSGLKVGVL